MTITITNIVIELVDEVATLLSELGLSDLKSVFAKEMIDYDILVTMTEDEMKELNIPFGARRKIIKSRHIDDT